MSAHKKLSAEQRAMLDNAWTFFPQFYLTNGHPAPKWGEVRAHIAAVEAELAEARGQVAALTKGGLSPEQRATAPARQERGT